MNIHYIRKRGILFFLILPFYSFCQENVDGEFIFKTQLFLEKVRITNTSGFKSKDKSLFNFFTENVELKFDTLSSVGFPSGFIFLSLATKNIVNKNTGVIYNDSIMKTDSAVFLFIGSNCKSYVLCLNKYTGKSFRLSGFEGNDFFNLFAEINKRLEILEEKKIAIKTFIKKFSVTSIDFGCLYGALKSGEYNKAKYPCLKGCEAENVIIH